MASLFASLPQLRYDTGDTALTSPPRTLPCGRDSCSSDWCTDAHELLKACHAGPDHVELQHVKLTLRGPILARPISLDTSHTLIDAHQCVACILVLAQLAQPERERVRRWRRAPRGKHELVPVKQLCRCRREW